MWLENDDNVNYQMAMATDVERGANLQLTSKREFLTGGNCFAIKTISIGNKACRLLLTSPSCLMRFNRVNTK